MTEKDIARIIVGNCGISIVGIKQVMEELAESYANKPDEEVASAMLERLGSSNYIPDKAREDYGRAFAREFRTFLGQPHVEITRGGLDIKVLGAGCAQCHNLTQTVMGVLTELGLPAGVEHIMDIKEIARYGVMGSPALLINGKVVAVGSVPPRSRIKNWLVEASAEGH